MKLKYVISTVVAGAIAGAAALGAAPASASLTGEVVGAAKSILPPVAVPAVQLPQSVPPPATPPPASTPDAPQAPATPPSEVTPTPTSPSNPVSTVASSTTKALEHVAEALPGGGKAGAKRGVDAIPSASKDAGQVPPPLRDGGSATLQDGRGASASIAQPETARDDATMPGAAPRKLTAHRAPPSIGSVRVAPLRRWLARVWPAIELGRARVALARLLEGAPPLPVSGVTRSLSIGIVRASAGGDPTLSEPAATPSPPPTAPRNSLVPGGREVTFFVVFSFVALLALLVSTLWVEVRSKYLYR